MVFHRAKVKTLSCMMLSVSFFNSFGLQYFYQYLDLDAIRMADKRQVRLKIIPKYGQELEILKYLSSPERSVDPRNHVIPLLDVHSLPDSETEALVVTPLCIFIDIYPKFETVAEWMACLYTVMEVRSSTASSIQSKLNC